MPDNNVFGVDFIARCMAAEALENGGGNAWTLVAGNNISILSDEEQKTETISAEIEVDSALSTTSENPVQNKVITNALKTKPTSVDTNGTPINDQKIMQLTRAQYNAIQNKDPNTYYYITDDPVPDAPLVVRTAYKSVLDDYTSSYDASGNWILTFQPGVSFEKLDVYLQWSFDWGAGTDWPVRTATRSIMLSLTNGVAGPVVSPSMNIYLANSISNPNNSDANLLYDVLMGSVNVNYDDQTNTVTMLVAKPIMNAISDPNNSKDSIPVTMTNCVANAFGYVAYGPDTINITTGLTAGDGIYIANDEISIDMPVGSEIGLSLNTATYVLTATLYDQDTVPISTATVDLPIESMVVSGTYDDNTKSIILTLQSGQTISFSVSDLVSGLETSTHAANTYQTISGMSNYLTTADASTTYQPKGSYATTTDISDMATETWVGNQGFLTSADEVPDVGSTDNGKILTASYSGGTGSYSWQAAQTGSDDYSDLTNKPSINNVTLSGNKTTSDLGIREVPSTSVSGKVLKSEYQNNTFSAVWDYVNEVPTVGSSDDGKFLKAYDLGGGNYAYGWSTAAYNEVPICTQSEDGFVLTADYNGGTPRYGWAPAPTEIPALTTADNKKVLQASVDVEQMTRSYDWETLSYNDLANTPNLATVATSGSYNDLINKPTIPAAQIQSDWNQTNNQALDYIKNKPSIPAAQVNSDWSASSGVSQILNKPDLSVYLTSSDLSGYATETWVGNQGYLTSSDVATVATTGDYGDLLNKPTIPAAQVNSDWNASSGVAQILNKPDLSNYATTTDISDMATQTWVGQQGYLTSADEVPTVTSTDDGKVLKATYSGGTGSYAWASAPSGLPASTSAEEGLALTVDSNGDPLWGSVGWDAIGNAIFPPTTDPNVNDGDVLTYDSTTGMASFQAPAASGL